MANNDGAQVLMCFGDKNPINVGFSAAQGAYAILVALPHCPEAVNIYFTSLPQA